MASNQNRLPKEELEKLKQLRSRTPEKWVEAVESLPQNIRYHAAKVAWWDWFGNRTVEERWNHLDGYLGFDNSDAPFNDLADALIALGYPEKIAITRASSGPRTR